MDENPPTILGKVFIFLATVAAGLLIIAGVMTALASTCIEVGGQLIRTGK